MITVPKGTSISHNVIPHADDLWLRFDTQRTVQIEILSVRGATRDNAGDTEMRVRFIAQTAGALTQFK